MQFIKKQETLILIILLIVIFYVFLRTTHPVFKNNDSPETSLASFTLGIGHPPGYPLFTLSGKIFNLLPIANPAFRTNMASIFISMLIIFINYIFLKKYLLNNIPEKFMQYILGYFSTFILAFNFLFWNQAIEAKGGIYILNLLFFMVLIFLAKDIIENYKVRNFYLFFYLYGLSLANHWPSMIIFFPWLIFLFYKNLKKLNLKDYFFIIFFLVIGISPYLYLIIRSKTNPVLNWGNPSTIENLFWVILRKGYIYPIKPGFDVILYQTKEFIRLFITNFNLLWIFSIFGVINLFNKNKRLFWFYLIIFLTIVFMVVFYNRTQKDLLWQMDIFLLPAEYIVYILIMTGICAVFKYRKDKIYKTIIIIFLFLVTIYMFKSNWNKNNNSRDFILYDYGKNILQTIELNSCYIGDGDYNLMPIYYFQQIHKLRNDIKFATVSFLIFKWGIDDFISRYDYIQMKPFGTNNNIKNIIQFYINKTNVYLSSYFPRLNEIDIKLKRNQKGILINLSNEKKIFSAKIFDLYSYRGIFEKNCLQNKMNKDLIGWYPVCMVNQANENSVMGDFEGAIDLYKRALLFPIDKPEDNIYYNLSLAYKGKKDIYNQLICLLKASEKTKERIIMEESILLCYYIGWLSKIDELMPKLSDKSENILKIYDVLSKLTNNEKYEIMLIKANELLNNWNFHIAELLYKNLIEKNYKKDIIYRNIGVYYFKTGNYDEALRYFLMSQNETNNSEIYLYLAFTQYKIGKKVEAIKTLKEGLQIFKEDKQLKNLLFNIEKEVLNK